MKTVYRPAAAIVPYKNDSLLCGLRGPGARSFKGYMVFPGGTVEPTDNTCAVLLPQEMSRTTQAHVVGALRELGEETGRWLLALPNGEQAPPDASSIFFKHLKAGQSLAEALGESKLALDGRELQWVGAVRSPDYGTTRFEVHQFFLKGCPEPQMEMQDELTDVTWRAITDIDQGWRAGYFAYLPPILRVMRALTRFGGTSRIPQAIKALQKNPAPSIEYREVLAGLGVQAYQTPTLPPATRTNMFLLGSENLFLVDPATPYPEEQSRCDALLERLVTQGKNLKAVVLSHHHHDHVGDATRISQKWDIPIWGHRKTAEKLNMNFDRYLDEGDQLGAWHLLHTPGHAPGHLCFWQPTQKTLVAADMVAEDSTIIIEPHDGGELAAYMASLKRLIALGPRTLTPSHGHLRTDGETLLRKTLAHREQRILQIKEALHSHPTPMTARELVLDVYAGEVPEAVYPLAELSVVSSLLYLQSTGLASEGPQGWSLQS